MDAAPTPPIAAPVNPVADPMMTDEAVATAIADAVPGTHDDGDMPTPLGEHVFSAVLVAIRRERNRCERVVREIAESLIATSKADEAKITIARLQGNEAEARELAMRMGANATVGAFLGRMLVVAISLPPGQCRNCLGRGVVPSKLAPGQGVPCPACVAPAAAIEDGAPTT